LIIVYRTNETKRIEREIPIFNSGCCLQKLIKNDVDFVFSIIIDFVLDEIVEHRLLYRINLLFDLVKMIEDFRGRYQN